MANLSSENLQCLRLMRALLCAISRNMRQVSLTELAPGDVLIRFLLETESQMDREEISDVLFEFEAQQEEGITVRSETTISGSLDTVLEGRLVFSRRE